MIQLHIKNSLQGGRTCFCCRFPLQAVQFLVCIRELLRLVEVTFDGAFGGLFEFLGHELEALYL